MARSLKLALAGLAALTVVRLVVAAVVPLSPDECYYWVWSRDLQAGYLDGPPMVAWWIRAGTLIAGQGALGVRLLGPLSAAVGSVLLYQAAEALLPGRNAGLWAAGLLNATLLFGAGTVIMTPDTPLLFFWVCATWAAAMFARDRWPPWLILVPILAGLAILSKYTAALLVLGVGLWLVVVPELRRSLVRPAIWW
ncbi:MAG: glycosyltransferase family 39 protein, partial [Acetobacteraceae bacterium]|nr:glycosyltransferase family 39 protein [Acetobacteraceae bacterium]